MLQNKLKNKGDGSIFSAKLCCLINRTVPILLLLVFTFCAFAQDEFVYDSKGKRNPFIPLVTSDGRLIKLDKEEARGGLWIEGIVYDKNGRSYALINGMVVEVGGVVGDYQVLKIEANKVIFIKDGQVTEVELKRED